MSSTDLLARLDECKLTKKDARVAPKMDERNSRGFATGLRRRSTQYERGAMFTPRNTGDDLLVTLTQEIERERERVRGERAVRRARHGDVMAERRRSIAGFARWFEDEALKSRKWEGDGMNGDIDGEIRRSRERVQEDGMGKKSKSRGSLERVGAIRRSNRKLHQEQAHHASSDKSKYQGHPYDADFSSPLTRSRTVAATSSSSSNHISRHNKSHSNPVLFSPSSMAALTNSAGPVQILVEDDERTHSHNPSDFTTLPHNDFTTTDSSHPDLSREPQPTGWDSGLTVHGKEAEAFIFALNNIVARGRRSSIDSDHGAGARPFSLAPPATPPTESPSYAHPIALSVSVSSDASENDMEPPVPATRKVEVGMRHRQPIIDCSDLFPDAVGERAGLYVFRIENMRPEVVTFDQFGRFCIADCYIVLSSAEAVEGEGVDAVRLNHRIWTWIGKEAEMDKRFCCAMYAVGLKNAIGGTGRVDRMTEAEESPEFAELFGGSLEHLDSTFATESGLYVAEKRRQYPLRVYRIQGKLNVFLQLVAPTSASLMSEHVYLIDAGLEIIQWNGSASSIGVRSKCRMFCESINASERVGRAQVFEMNEGEEDEWLWDVLPESEDIPTALPEALATHPISVYRAPADASDDSDDEITDPVKNVVSSGEKLKRGLLKTDGCFVIDVGCEVFLWIGLGARPEVKVAAGEIMARVIRLVDRPPWLALQRAIEGHEPEAFKLRFPDWADSDPARKLLLRPERQQPALPGIEVDVQALYTAKNSFGSLGNIASEESTIEETFKKANQQLVSMTLFMHDKSGRFIRVPAQEQEHVWNGDAYLFLCVYSKKPVEGRISASRRSEIQKQGSEGSVSIVESMDDCSVNGSELESEDGESSDVMTESAYDDTEDLANEMDEVDCIVYFWEGRKASRVAYSAFRFQALSEMENLVRNMYGCGVSVVHTVQGREPVELLAHLGNRIVVYRGNRKTDRWRLRAAPDSASMPPSQGSHVSPAADSHDKVLHPDKPMHFHQTILFHIRTEGKWRTARAVEVSPVSIAALVSRDCFLVCKFPLQRSNDVPFAFLWVGRGARRDDVRNAKDISDRILSVLDPQEPIFDKPFTHEPISETSLRPSGRFRIVSEKLEPKAFWECFVDGHLRLSSAALMSPISPTPSIASANSAITPRSESATGHALRSTAITGILPRLLLCTCSSGNFRVIEIADFVQTDLDTTTCAIVDPGPPDHVFVWCGLEASDVVRTLTRKAVEIWVRETNRGDGEGELECVEWVEEGEEGAAFRTVFLGWEVGGADAGKRVKDPGNRFKREEELRKSKTSKAGTTTVTA